MLAFLFRRAIDKNYLSQSTQDSEELIVSADLHVHRQDIGEKITVLGCDDQGLPVIRELKFSHFAASDWQIEGLLLDFLPIVQADDLHFVLPSQGKLVEQIINGQSLKGSIEDPLRFNLILDFLRVSGNMTVVALGEPDNEIAIPKDIIIDNLPILILENELALRAPIFRRVIDEDSLLVENSTDRSLGPRSFFSFRRYPFYISRLAPYCDRVAYAFRCVGRYCYDFVLASCCEQALVVPVARDDAFRVLAHCRDLLLVLF